MTIRNPHNRRRIIQAWENMTEGEMVRYGDEVIRFISDKTHIPHTRELERYVYDLFEEMDRQAYSRQAYTM